MVNLPVRLFGDPVLTTPAAEVTVFDASLRKLAHDMLETMDAAGGVGLAANQVGVLKSVFTYDCQGLRGVLVNPTWASIGNKLQVGPEGCLSIPGVRAEVPRHDTVVARGVDVEGKPVAIRASGLLARCIQHESDHLDGVLFLTRMEPAVRAAAMAEIRAAEWSQQRS